MTQSYISPLSFLLGLETIFMPRTYPPVSPCARGQEKRKEENHQELTFR